MSIIIYIRREVGRGQSGIFRGEGEIFPVTAL